MDDFAAQDLRQRRVPDPIVNVQYFRESFFERTDEQTLPNDGLVALRAHRSIDLMGFNLA